MALAGFDAKRLPTCPTTLKYHREDTRLPGGLPRSSLAVRGVRPENDGNSGAKKDDHVDARNDGNNDDKQDNANDATSSSSNAEINAKNGDTNDAKVDAKIERQDRR